MVPSDRQYVIEHATSQADYSHDGYRRFWLVLASLWLMVMVIAFVVINILYRVHTPISDWVQRLFVVFSLR